MSEKWFGFTCAAMCCTGIRVRVRVRVCGGDGVLVDVEGGQVESAVVLHLGLAFPANSIRVRVRVEG